GPFPARCFFRAATASVSSAASQLALLDRPPLSRADAHFLQAAPCWYRPPHPRFWTSLPLPAPSRSDPPQTPIKQRTIPSNRTLMLFSWFPRTPLFLFCEFSLLCRQEPRLRPP